MGISGLARVRRLIAKGERRCTSRFSFRSAIADRVDRIKRRIEDAMDPAFDPKRLKELRKSQRLSQRQLAAKSGVCQSVIAEVERGKHPPSKSSLAKLAGALEIREADFFSTSP